MLAGKSAMAGIAIGATAFACSNASQGASSIVATGTAIMPFRVRRGNGHAVHPAFCPGMTARAIGCHSHGQ